MPRFHPLLAPLRDAILSARADRSRLRIRGGGSKDFYGRSGGGAVLDTTPLRGILSYEPSELVVTAAAGTPLIELEHALAQRGQYLPFEPPHYGWSQAAPSATVGGMVASGLCGPARVGAGALRDYVLGVQLLNGQGQTLNFGGQVIKNVAGYDVSRLMVGSLGTLGVLTQVSLKVMPRPAAQATLAFALPQQDALAYVQRWAAQPLPLNASCWLAAGPDAAEDTLWLRLRGAQAAVQTASAQLLAQAHGRCVDAETAEQFWSRLRDHRLAFFQPPAQALLWRLALAPTAAALDWPTAPLVEWHGGLRWIWAEPQAGEALRALAEAQGGNATIFVATNPDGTRADAQFVANDPVRAALEQRVRLAMDPDRIFADRAL